MTSIGSISQEPLYTIRAVSSKMGIKTVTLRAWERRYNLLSPTRMANSYRLYSEQDVQVLLWAKDKLAQGESISQVAHQLNHMRKNDQWPEAVTPAPPELPKKKAPRPARDYAEMLYGALITHQEVKASYVMDDVEQYFEIPTIFEEVLYPSLVLIGEAWYRGDIRIATEHFASSFVRGRLMRILQSIPMRRDAGLILVGCGPEEAHEIASLMFAVLLRRDGYHVEYLGPDLPIQDLVDYAETVRPKIICLSISAEESANSLKGLAEQLNTLRGKPKLVYGGRYFNENVAARSAYGGIYLGSNLSEGLEKIKELMPNP